MPGDNGTKREVRKLRGEQGSPGETALGDVVRQSQHFRSDVHYAESEQRKAAAQARYRASEQGKEAHTRYRASEKGKETYARYRKSEQGKAIKTRSNAEERAKKYGQKKIDGVLTKEQTKQYTQEQSDGRRAERGGSQEGVLDLNMGQGGRYMEKEEYFQRFKALGNVIPESYQNAYKREYYELTASPEPDDKTDKRLSAN